MIKLKTFEDHTIVNAKDLIDSGNWTASYHVNKAKGKKPYVKQGDMFVSFFDLGSKKSLPQNAYYLTEDEANKLNEIGQKLTNLKKEQQDLLDISNEILKK